MWLVGGIHAGWNYFQGNIFGLPVSGHSESTSLFTIGPARHSTAALSGGTFGLEASLLGTVVLAAATVVAFVLFRRAPDPGIGQSVDQPSAATSYHCAEAPPAETSAGAIDRRWAPGIDPGFDQGSAGGVRGRNAEAGGPTLPCGRRAMTRAGRAAQVAKAAAV